MLKKACENRTKNADKVKSLKKSGLTLSIENKLNV